MLHHHPLLPSIHFFPLFFFSFSTLLTLPQEIGSKLVGGLVAPRLNRIDLGATPKLIPLSSFDAAEGSARSAPLFSTNKLIRPFPDRLP
jgi:hypothetical protein